MRVPRQTPLNPPGAHCTGIGRFAPQDPMAALPFDLDRRDIEIEAGQFVAERFALRRDKVPMQLLFKSMEILNGRTRFSTLTQKVMKLIHGVGLTGHEVIALPCLHRGSPLVYVGHALTPLFQSGDAPSRGPRRTPGSTEQTPSMFIYQYVIYTHQTLRLDVCSQTPHSVCGSVIFN